MWRVSKQMKIRCETCDYIAYAADSTSDRALRNHDCAVCGCVGFRRADDPWFKQFDDEPADNLAVAS